MNPGNIVAGGGGGAGRGGGAGGKGGDGGDDAEGDPLASKVKGINYVHFTYQYYSEACEDFKKNQQVKPPTPVPTAKSKKKSK